MARPFAAFDIDGTIIRWQLYHAIVDALVKQGSITAADFRAVREARMSWKQRSHESSFSDYETALVSAYHRVITSLSFDDFMIAASHVFDEYKDQTYTYTRDLIEELRSKNYLLFAISGSQQEIVEMLATYYGFDAWAGSIYQRDNDRFTGEEIALRGTRKIQAVQDMVKQFGATAKGSLAVGDSKSDIPMLELAEQPIAFNPDKKLFQYAKTQGWKVVLERKNMVYQLEFRDGAYLLA